MKLATLAPVVILASVVRAEEVDLASHADDLVLSLRAHSEKIMFGDPLFIEVTVVNSGKDVVRAAPLNEALLQIRAREHASKLELILTETYYTGGGLGLPPGVTSYLHGKSQNVFMILPMPSGNYLRHSFWKMLESGGTIDLHVIFYLSRTLLVTGYPLSIRITPRPADELAALERWSLYKKEFGDTRMTPGPFGATGLNGVRSRQDTQELAASVKSGELPGLLQLTIRMQQLESDWREKNVEGRDTNSQSLVEWVRAQPDIKRQWLARQLSGNFSGAFSPAALSELKEIMNEPIQKDCDAQH